MSEPTDIEIPKDAFIKRLMEAGWPEDEARQEWENIQNEEEGEL